MNYRKILIATAFSFFIYFLPQNIFSDNIEKADKYYEKYDYKYAIDLYEKVMLKKPSLEVAQKLANCYRFINDTEAAEQAYARVLTFEDFEPINYKYYADALKQNSRFDKAKENFLLYGQAVPSKSEEARVLANACDAAKMWAENPEPNVSIENELGLNSEYSEFSPVKYKNGYVFVSDRWFVKTDASKKSDEVYGWTGNPYLKLYESSGESSPKLSLLPKPVNNEFHTGSAVFTASGDTIYFSRSEADNSKKGKGKVIGRNFIYYSVKTNNEWSEPVALGFNSDATFSVQHPAISADGNILYFASDMPGGLGGNDIYASRKTSSGSWGNPVNCGPNVNSTDDEGFPSVSVEGNLYFSSKGHVGMGGLDIFTAKGSYNNFGIAENLRSPINSPKDDFGLLYLNDKSGLISSNRNGGRGLDDIYRFNISTPKLAEAPVLAVEGQVLDKEDGSVLAQLPIHLINTQTGKQLTVLSDASGKFRFDLEADQNYIIKGDDNRYFTRQEGQISTKGVTESTTFSVKFELERSDAAYLVRLNNIHYDFNKWNIRPDAANEMNKVLSFMMNTPNVNIEMRAHTDSRGTAAYNQLLSQKRAESAVAYLRNNGVNADRYTAAGLGETQLLTTCGSGPCTEADHQLNRRTEFKVVKMKPAASSLTASLRK
ncbi:OmpA family protein [Flavihumibacter sp. R14]|nr:OmpA family protein [Flavihumibacter soli]